LAATAAVLAVLNVDPVGEPASCWTIVFEVEDGKKYEPTIAAAIRTERTVIVILFILVSANEVIVSQSCRLRI
jgi:hypothetical protein